MNFLIIWSLFAISSVYAGEWSELTGEFELRAGEFLTETEDFPQNMGQSFLSVQTLGSYENLEFKLAPAYTHNFQNLEQLNNSSGHFLSSELKVEYISNTLAVTVGMDRVNWGVGDGFNPINGFRAFDLADPIFPRELSQVQFGFKYHPSEEQDFVFEFILVPDGHVDRLPLSQSRGTVDPQDSRWGIVLPQSAELNVNSSVPLSYEIRRENNNSRADFAARLRFLQINGWDYSVALGQFRRKRAVLRYEVRGDASVPNLPLNVLVRPHYSRRDMLGFDAAGTINDYGVRIEAAKYFVKESDKSFGYDSFLGNFGIDRIWDDVFKNSSLYINIAYIIIENSITSSFDKNSIDLAVTDSYGTIKFELRSELWTYGLDYLVTVNKDSIITLSTRYQWSDALELELLGNFLNGVEDEGLGRLSGNHRLIGSIKYLF